MSVQKEDLSPFKHRNGYAPGGINVDLINAISDKIGMEITYMDYSIAEGRKKFQSGELNVDCCLSPIWFPNQDDLHIFSDPLYRLIEVWIFPAGKEFRVPDTSVLKNKRVGGIKGFTYPNEEDYGVRIDGVTPFEVLELVSTGKVDIAVLERHAASFLINHHDFNVTFGDSYYSTDVGVRLHKSQAHLLPAVNNAVKELRESGRVQAIIRRNIR